MGTSRARQRNAARERPKCNDNNARRRSLLLGSPHRPCNCDATPVALTRRNAPANPIFRGLRAQQVEYQSR
eukprot:5702146-Lingulodinium_polyedra.AAC.1